MGENNGSYFIWIVYDLNGLKMQLNWMIVIKDGFEFDLVSEALMLWSPADFGIVESHFPMLISLQVFVWSGLVVCLSRLYFLNYNLLGHNNSIPSSLFEENPRSWSVRRIMFLHLHDKYLNNCAIMLLPSETSYAWIGLLVVAMGMLLLHFCIRCLP